MARIDIAPGEGEEGTRLFQARPELGAAMTALSRAVLEHSQLPVRERGKSCACALRRSINALFDWPPALHRRCRTI